MGIFHKILQKSTQLPNIDFSAMKHAQGCPRQEDTTHRFFQSSVYYYSSYTRSKISEKFAVTDEKIFRVYKAFDCKK